MVRYSNRRIIIKPEYNIKIKEVEGIFVDMCCLFAKNNKFFFELFFKSAGSIQLIMKNMFEYFLFYYQNKLWGEKSKRISMNKYRTPEQLKARRLKFIAAAKLRVRSQVTFKRKKRILRKERSYRYINQRRVFSNLDRQKNRIARFIKTSLDGRTFNDQSIFRSKRIVMQNLANYSNFGIIAKRKEKIRLNSTKFGLYTRLICIQFFRNLIIKLHRTHNNFNFSVITKKFYTRIFDFCMFQDLKSFSIKNYAIESKNLDTEDDADACEDVDVLKFCSGLTVKFTIKRRNCFFQIWEDLSGFTLAKISGGLFGYYFKKSIRRFKNFNAFTKFFRTYFNSILIAYRKRIFKRFVTLRHIASYQYRIKKFNFFKNSLDIDEIVRKFDKLIIKLQESILDVPNIRRLDNFYNLFKRHGSKFNISNIENFKVVNQIANTLPNRLISSLKSKLKCNLRINIKNSLLKKENGISLFKCLDSLLYLFLSDFDIFKNSQVLLLAVGHQVINLKIARKVRRQSFYIACLKNKKMKRIKKWKRLKRRMMKRIHFNGFNFMCFHRSKLKFTYILAMRKPFFQRKKVLSPHWLDIYTKFQKLEMLTKISRRYCVFTLLRSFYRFSNQSARGRAFYKILNYVKKFSDDNSLIKLKRLSVYNSYYSQNSFSAFKYRVCKFLSQYKLARNIKVKGKNKKFKCRLPNFKILFNIPLSKYNKYLKKSSIFSLFNKLLKPRNMTKRRFFKQYKSISALKTLVILNNKVKKLMKNKNKNEKFYGYKNNKKY